jgi:hypothetical protein
MDNKRYLSLIIGGIAIAFLYGFYFLFKFPLTTYYKVAYDLGKLTYHSSIGFWAFIGIMLLLFILFSYSLLLSRRFVEKRALWIILGFGALFCLMLTFVYPLTAQDIYTYISQSKLFIIYQKNPVFVPPSTYPNDPMMQIAGQWIRYGSPYGPLGIIVDALPMNILRNNLLGNLIALKLIFSGFLLGSAYLSYLIVKEMQPKRAISAALFVAWNPLLLFEVVVNGHNDIVMMFFVLWAIYVFLKGEYKIGTILLLLSILVKYATVLLLPLFIIYAFHMLPSRRKKISYIVSVLVGGAIVATAAYTPFWQGFSTLNRSFLEMRLHMQSFMSILMNFFPNGFSFERAQLISRLVFLVPFIYCLFLARKSKEDFLRACFYTLFFFLALGISNFKIWYAIWPVIFAAIIPQRVVQTTAIVFACCATLSVAVFSYIWMWFSIKNPTTFTWADSIAYFVAFLPPIVLWMIVTLRTKKKLSKSK